MVNYALNCATKSQYRLAPVKINITLFALSFNYQMKWKVKLDFNAFIYLSLLIDLMLMDDRYLLARRYARLRTAFHYRKDAGSRQHLRFDELQRAKHYWPRERQCDASHLRCSRRAYNDRQLSRLMQLPRSRLSQQRVTDELYILRELPYLFISAMRRRRFLELPAQFVPPMPVPVSGHSYLRLVISSADLTLSTAREFLIIILI